MDRRLERYFEETDRKKRAGDLDEIRDDAAIDSGAKQILQILWELRYEAQRNRYPVQDAFLEGMMDLLMINSQLKSGFGWKRQQKQMIEVGRSFGLDLMILQEEKANELFRREYQNAAAYFVQLGTGDKAYGSGIMNLRELSEKKLHIKQEKDLQIMCRKLPEEFGLVAFYRPFTQGVEEWLERIKLDRVKEK